MREETGKAIEVQRRLVNSLHLIRGEEVQLTRAMREEGIVPANVRAQQWEKIEVLTGQIELAELELKALERDRPVGQLLEALDMIADMPAFDAEVGVTLEQLVRQYDEARETARLAVAWYERVSGEVAHG